MNFYPFFAPTVLKSILCTCLVACSYPSVVWSKDMFSGDGYGNYVEHTESGGMVSSQEAIASQVGAYILKKGGNAVDSAVAIGFAMAVTYPQAGNLGGGGFMLVHDAKSGQTKAIDYREVAPSAATADMFLNSDGTVDTDRIRFSHKSAGVPGTVRGLELALNTYGTMTMEEVLAPAILLADNGFAVSDTLAKSFRKYKKNLLKSEESNRVFFKGISTLYYTGDVFRQPDLAMTLKSISNNGADAFYKGNIADKIVKSMREHGGLITKTDLYEYSPIIREPLWGNYEGYKIASMPPPSSGGVHLIQMLNLLGRLGISETKQGTADSYHLMAEAMRVAYADRSKYLGDPQFVKVPTDALMSDVYAQRKAEGISMDSVTPSNLIEAGAYLPYESRQTTHFSVMDKWGNVVSNTYTLNFPYGSGRTVEGTGILLNNEMDDFAAKAGVPNAFGLVGAEANKIEPRKRPLSSMTPTIVFNDKGQPVMALGAPGGSRIINAVLQTIVNVITYDMSPADAVNEPRVHHQWLPDVLSVEDGVSDIALRALEAKGHTLKKADVLGAVQLVALVDSYGKLIPATSDLTDIAIVSETDLSSFVGVPDIDPSTGLIKKELAEYGQFGYTLVGVADSRKASATSVSEYNIGTSLNEADFAWIKPPQMSAEQRNFMSRVNSGKKIGFVATKPLGKKNNEITATVAKAAKSSAGGAGVSYLKKPSEPVERLQPLTTVVLDAHSVVEPKMNSVLTKETAESSENIFEDIDALFDEKNDVRNVVKPTYQPSRKLTFSQRFGLSKK